MSNVIPRLTTGTYLEGEERVRVSRRPNGRGGPNSWWIAPEADPGNSRLLTAERRATLRPLPPATSIREALDTGELDGAVLVSFLFGSGEPGVLPIEGADGPPHPPIERPCDFCNGAGKYEDVGCLSDGTDEVYSRYCHCPAGDALRAS